MKPYRAIPGLLLACFPHPHPAAVQLSRHRAAGNPTAARAGQSLHPPSGRPGRAGDRRSPRRPRRPRLICAPPTPCRPRKPRGSSSTPPCAPWPTRPRRRCAPQLGRRRDAYRAFYLLKRASRQGYHATVPRWPCTPKSPKLLPTPRVRQDFPPELARAGSPCRHRASSGTSPRRRAGRVGARYTGQGSSLPGRILATIGRIRPYTTSTGAGRTAAVSHNYHLARCHPRRQRRRRADWIPPSRANRFPNGHGYAHHWARWWRRTAPVINSASRRCAQWIGCRNMDAAGYVRPPVILNVRVLPRAVPPSARRPTGGAPTLALAPDVINNSWSLPP
jgi:hypothetical protein